VIAILLMVVGFNGLNLLGAPSGFNRSSTAAF